MPQIGIHAIIGIVSRKWMPRREWLFLGVVLGNMFPDLDNLVVAYATLAKLPNPEDYHRTFTHSVFTIVTAVVLFYILATLTKNEKWKNFGTGFGAGILTHILVDLVLWFNGVSLLWPIKYELNFWSWFEKPAWLSIVLDTAEFLAFYLYFLLLGSLSQRHNTDTERQGSTRIWAFVELMFFIVFTALFFTISTRGLLYQVFGALYLVSLIVGMVITTRMKQTVESI